MDGSGRNVFWDNILKFVWRNQSYLKLTINCRVVTTCTTRFNTNQFYVLPTQCIYVVCVDLRTNSDYFTVQHWLTGFYNWDCVFTARYVLHSTFCPHSVFMWFVWIWEQTAIISLYSINWLVFINEMGSVHCAVRAASLTTIQVNLSI